MITPLMMQGCFTVTETCATDKSRVTKTRYTAKQIVEIAELARWSAEFMAIIKENSGIYDNHIFQTVIHSEIK